MSAFVIWRKRNFLLFDSVLSTVLIAIITVAAHMAFSVLQLAGAIVGVRTTLYGSASAGCAALLGFIITTTTLTDAVVQNPKWEAFRNSLAYSQVQDIYFNTIRWLGLSSLVFLLFLIIDTDAHPQLFCEVISLWLITVIACRMWRSIGALEQILRTNSYKVVGT